MSATADWLAAIGALLAALAAFAACFAAFGQAEHARRSADIQTFTIRYAVYETVIRAYSHFLQSGRLSDEDFNGLSRAERESEFLFSANARSAIERLRFEMIRYTTKRDADVFYPKSGDATLESCDTFYQAATKQLLPRLHISGAAHPVTQMLDELELTFLGPR